VCDILFFQSLHAVYHNRLFNLIRDCDVGFRTQLEIVGIGYRAMFDEDDPDLLKMKLGYCNTKDIYVPHDILCQLDKKGLVLTIFGKDRLQVRSFVDKIRSFRKPDPYKGKGVRFLGQKMRLKKVKKK